MASRSNEEPKVEMTPMIDVVFQLLIFFVVTLKQEDILAKLMASRPAPDPNAKPDQQPDLIDITVHKHGFIFKQRAVSLEGLDRQIELVDPKIIVCLGRIAAMGVIKDDFRITREHGQWFTLSGRMYMATFHPSALLRDPSKRPEAFMDLRALRKEIREICTRTY